jgi:putative phosphoribosyl transferase
MIYNDREDAGERLGERLAEWTYSDPLVLAIPRGGVVVGAAVANRLGAELEVVLSRKLRAPEQPELALGAVGEDGKIVLDPRHGADGIPGAYLEGEAAREMEEIRRRVALFRGERAPPRVAGRSVIVVDDGVATGSTALAALRTVRAQGPKELILATPVMGSEHGLDFGAVCDRVVSLQTPDDFWAIGQFYRDFTQVEDREVVEILARARVSRERGAGTGGAR